MPPESDPDLHDAPPPATGPDPRTGSGDQPMRHRKASDIVQELFDQAEIEDTGIQQVQQLQHEIRVSLEKINVLNDLYYSIGPYTVTEGDIRKLLVIAESLRGIAHFGERVAMGEAGSDVDGTIETKSAGDLAAGDLVVYRSAVFGPQNLRIVKLYGTTKSGKLLFETEAISMYHDQLPSDMRFLELAPNFMIETVTVPVEVHDPAPDALGVGAGFKDIQSEREQDADFWDGLAAIVKQNRMGGPLNPHLMEDPPDTAVPPPSAPGTDQTLSSSSSQPPGEAAHAATPCLATVGSTAASPATSSATASPATVSPAAPACVSGAEPPPPPRSIFAPRSKQATASGLPHPSKKAPRTGHRSSYVSGLGSVIAPPSFKDSKVSALPAAVAAAMRKPPGGTVLSHPAPINPHKQPVPLDKAPTVAAAPVPPTVLSSQIINVAKQGRRAR